MRTSLLGMQMLASVVQDANTTCRELALLTINAFQRDLSDPNQLIRGLALRVLCGIRVREIVQIQIMSVKKCATDSSPYVRKTAAHSVGKIYSLDPDAKEELMEIVDRLLDDKTTAVLSSAVAAFNELCPDNFSMIHPYFRKLCSLLADLDEWGQIAALNILTRYARTQFVNPEPEDVRWAYLRAHARARVRACLPTVGTCTHVRALLCSRCGVCRQKRPSDPSPRQRPKRR
ncbi:hypothetical protein EON66_05765 [archaeon]|nr:MAG: hypothetical protein EON66_05765 [archaeon]